MATLNFYLDAADKNGRSFIQMTYLANGQKFRHSVKIKVTPAEWLKGKQRIRVKEPEDEFTNSHLKSLEEIIRKAERESLLLHNELNFSFIKQKFNDSFDKRTVKKTLLEYFEEYIETSKSKRKEQTIKSYNTTLQHLIKFRKLKKYELTFERINNQFYELYVSYLRNDCKILNNTLGNYIKRIKSFMNYANEMGYNKSGDDFKKFKVLREDGELIYLTEQELMNIYYMEGLNEKLRVVRENFCFAAFTGLRFSDIQKLQLENIKEDYLEIRTEKTKEFQKIPLSPYAKQILIRNEGKLPRQFSNQKVNDYLKDLGELAGINEQIHIVKYRGVEKVEFIEPKYKFICTHTARRTFVTVSLEKGTISRSDASG